MDFELSEEQKMIQSLARDFVEGRLKPLERELLGKAADLSDARAYLPAEKENELVKTVRDMGLWGLGVPAGLGGAGLDTLSVCLVEEELANTIVPFRCGDVTPLLFECSDAQKEKYFTPALNHEKRPYLALAEDNSAGLSNMKTTARKENGHYIIDGRKFAFSRPGGDYFGVVFTQTEKGITCFLVDKDTPGFTVGVNSERNGWLSRVREPLALYFEKCRVAVENLLGEEGKAFRLGGKWLPLRRIVRGARSVGAARRLLEEAVDQAQSASAFGQPAASRASVRAALADIAASVHAARLTVFEAACLADAGKTVYRQATLVKLHTSRMLRNVTDLVSHIFSGPSEAADSIKKLCRHVAETKLQEIALERQQNAVAVDILKGLKV